MYGNNEKQKGRQTMLGYEKMTMPTINTLQKTFVYAPIQGTPKAMPPFDFHGDNNRYKSTIALLDRENSVLQNTIFSTQAPTRAMHFHQ